MPLPQALREKFTHHYLNIPLHKHLNLSLHTLNEDGVTVSLPMADHLIGNPYTAILHGGAISAVLDAVSGLSAALALFAKQTTSDLSEEQITAIITGLTTINININYLRPGKGAQFYATATTIRSGRRITLVHFNFTNDSDTLIATGTANFIGK